MLKKKSKTHVYIPTGSKIIFWLSSSEKKNATRWKEAAVWIRILWISNVQSTASTHFVLLLSKKKRTHFVLPPYVQICLCPLLFFFLRWYKNSETTVYAVNDRLLPSPTLSLSLSGSNKGTAWSHLGQTNFDFLGNMPEFLWIETRIQLLGVFWFGRKDG